MKKPLAYLVLLLALGTSFALAQQTGKIIVVANENAWLDVNGENKMAIKANKPTPLTLVQGEHYLHLVAWQADSAETGQLVAVKAGSQKVVKLTVGAAPPANTPAAKKKTNAAAAITVLQSEFFIPSLAMEMAEVGGLVEPTHDANKEHIIYLAFEEGDEIVLNVNMQNKKGTNGVVVQTYPDGVKAYTNNDFQNLENIRIKVPKRSIYRFEFYTYHLLPRDVNVNIGRTPANKSTSGFNTAVSLKTIYTPVQVVQKQLLYLNSSSNDFFKGGSTRGTVAISFPANTVKWYYEFAASRDEQMISRVLNQFKLLESLTTLIDETGALDFLTSSIFAPPGSDYCDVYLLPAESHSQFMEKLECSYYREGSRINLTSGVVDVAIVGPDLELGFRNRNQVHGINVALEVVAITAKTDFFMHAEN